ncbi:unknown protein [Seminavis robusta]|uniref:Uncharacterized protein n=1 Tax=Seminavis robusta TaxID=568900 RepID=A0A9N8F3L1_9STRA|nr:unknown protein [Seminavis robusta]|eukprot:Sro2744_g336050.1 n/a (696) ;mRNA; r:4979-7066
MPWGSVSHTGRTATWLSLCLFLGLILEQVTGKVVLSGRTPPSANDVIPSTPQIEDLQSESQNTWERYLQAEQSLTPMVPSPPIANGPTRGPVMAQPSPAIDPALPTETLPAAVSPETPASPTPTGPVVAQPSPAIDPALSNGTLPTAASTRIPICLLDSMGFPVPPNDPRSVAPDTQPLISEVTFEEAGTTIEDINGVIETIEFFGAFVPGVGPFIADGAAALTQAVKFLGPIFGLQSEADVLLAMIQSGFQQISTQLGRMQIENRQSFLQIESLILNVTFDEIAGQLDHTLSAFQNLVNASGTNGTRPSPSALFIYDARFRAICNEASPYNPEVIFRDLYGYACSDCMFSSRRRANFFDIALREARFSGIRFRTDFASFIYMGMVQAMMLTAACLPPQGTCNDGSTDIVFRENMEDMGDALDEVVLRLNETVSDLEVNFWRNLLILPELRDQIFSLADGDEESRSNQDIADDIWIFLTSLQPDFFIQVIVALNPQEDFTRRNIWRTVCEGDGDGITEDCPSSNFITQGFVDFDSIAGNLVHIRYRHRALGEPDFSVTIAGETMSLGDFVTELANRPAIVTDQGLNGCDDDNAAVCASNVIGCHDCNDEELTEFNRFFSSGRASYLVSRFSDGDNDNFDSLAVRDSFQSRELASIFPVIRIQTGVTVFVGGFGCEFFGVLADCTDRSLDGFTVFL